MSAISELLAILPAWVGAITGLVTACSVISALTPSTSDDRIVAGILRVLNVLSLNVGGAAAAPALSKNADDK